MARKCKFTREFIIDEVRTLCDILGKTPTLNQFILYSESKNAFNTLFDRSYNVLLTAAGLKKNRNYPFHIKNKTNTAKTIRPGNVVWNKRYPIKYMAATVALKWSRRRTG